MKMKKLGIPSVAELPIAALADMVFEYQKKVAILDQILHDTKRQAGLDNSNFAIVRDEIIRVAQDPSINFRELAEATQLLFRKGMSSEEISDRLPLIGEIIAGTGADGREVALVDWVASHVQGISMEERESFISKFVATEYAGFRFEDMAPFLPAGLTNLEKLGVTGNEAAASLGAFLQIALESAKVPNRTARYAGAFLEDIASAETQIRLKEEFGVDIKDILEGSQDPIGDIHKALISVTGGDVRNLGDLFDRNSSLWGAELLMRGDMASYDAIHRRSLKNDSAIEEKFQEAAKDDIFRRRILFEENIAREFSEFLNLNELIIETKLFLNEGKGDKIDYSDLYGEVYQYLDFVRSPTVEAVSGSVAEIAMLAPWATAAVTVSALVAGAYTWWDETRRRDPSNYFDPERTTIVYRDKAPNADDLLSWSVFTDRVLQDSPNNNAHARSKPDSSATIQRVSPRRMPQVSRPIVSPFINVRRMPVPGRKPEAFPQAHPLPRAKPWLPSHDRQYFDQWNPLRKGAFKEPVKALGGDDSFGSRFKHYFQRPAPSVYGEKPDTRTPVLEFPSGSLAGVPTEASAMIADMRAQAVSAKVHADARVSNMKNANSTTNDTQITVNQTVTGPTAPEAAARAVNIELARVANRAADIAAQTPMSDIA